MELFAKMKILTKGGKYPDTESTLDKMGEMLIELGEKGTIQFRILTGKKRFMKCLVIEEKSYTLSSNVMHNPNLELIIFSETWLEIAKGNISPLDALTKGKLRVRGDMTFAERIFKKLATTDGKTSIC